VIFSGVPFVAGHLPGGFGDLSHARDALSPFGAGRGGVGAPSHCTGDESGATPPDTAVDGFPLPCSAAVGPVRHPANIIKANPRTATVGMFWRMGGQRNLAEIRRLYQGFLVRQHPSDQGNPGTKRFNIPEAPRNGVGGGQARCAVIALIIVASLPPGSAGAQVDEGPGPASPLDSAVYMGCHAIEGRFHPPAALVSTQLPPGFSLVEGPVRGTAIWIVVVYGCASGNLGELGEYRIDGPRFVLQGYVVVPPEEHREPGIQEYWSGEMPSFGDGASKSFFTGWDVLPKQGNIEILGDTEVWPGNWYGGATYEHSYPTGGSVTGSDWAVAVYSHIMAMTPFEEEASRVRVLSGNSYTGVRGFMDIHRPPMAGVEAAAKWSCTSYCGYEVPYASAAWSARQAYGTGTGRFVHWQDNDAVLNITNRVPAALASHLAPLEPGAEEPEALDNAAKHADPNKMVRFEGSSTSLADQAAEPSNFIPVLAFVGIAILQLRFQIAQLLGTALFSRIARHRALDHGRRAWLVDSIGANPGIRFAQLRKATGIGSGPLMYHLRVLERTRHVRVVRQGGKTSLFLVGVPVGQDPYVASSRERVLEVVLNHPGIDQRRLAKRVGIPRKNVAYHVKRLESEGRLSTTVDGRRRIHSPH